MRLQWRVGSELADVAAATVHALQLRNTLRNGRMCQLKVLPPGLYVLPDGCGSLVSAGLVEQRIDSHHRTHSAEEFLLLAMRAIGFHPGRQLRQSAREIARTPGHQRAAGISAGFTRTHHEHLHDARELAGRPEDRIADNRTQDRSDAETRRRFGLDVEGLLEDLDGAHPGVDHRVGRQEEDARENRHERIDTDVIVFDVTQLVREDCLDFRVGKPNLEQALGGGDHGFAMDRTSRKSVWRHRCSDVDRRLELQSALGEDLVHDANQPLMNGVRHVNRHCLSHLERDFRAKPPGYKR